MNIKKLKYLIANFQHYPTHNEYEGFSPIPTTNIECFIEKEIRKLVSVIIYLEKIKQYSKLHPITLKEIKKILYA